MSLGSNPEKSKEAALWVVQDDREVGDFDEDLVLLAQEEHRAQGARVFLDQFTLTPALGDGVLGEFLLATFGVQHVVSGRSDRWGVVMSWGWLG